LLIFSANLNLRAEQLSLLYKNM